MSDLEILRVKLGELDGARLMSIKRRYNEEGFLRVLRLNDDPSTMFTVLASPVKMSDIAHRFDIGQDLCAILGCMRRNHNISVHRRVPFHQQLKKRGFKGTMYLSHFQEDALDSGSSDETDPEYENTQRQEYRADVGKINHTTGFRYVR